MKLFAAPVLLVLAAQAAAAPQAEETWRALPLPALTAEGPEAPPLRRLRDGSHLELPDDDDPEPEVAASPELTVQSLLELLREDTRRRDLAVALHPTAPPLIARGSPEALGAVEARLNEIEVHARSFEVALEAWLLPAAGPGTTRPDRAAFERLVADAPPLARRRVRSGTWASFGERRASAFVADYRVEVAADSGVATPELGQQLTGQTVHVRACRVENGARIHLEGFLDLSVALRSETFDPDTPDLGILHLPRVRVLQVAFAGAVESGELLCVELRGTEFEPADWTLWLRAATTPGPALELHALDLALVESRAVDLPLPLPGAGLPFREPPRRAPVRLESISSSTLAAVFEQSRTARSEKIGRGPWPLVSFSPALLLAVPDDAAAWSHVADLVATAERARCRGAELVVRSGGTTARVPVTAGLTARFLSGVEQSVVSAYEVQVAPETWMPAPDVERTFDGVLLQGHLQGDRFWHVGWWAASARAEEFGRADLGIARLDLQRRSFAPGSGSVLADGASYAVLAAGQAAQEAALAVAVTALP